MQILLNKLYEGENLSRDETGQLFSHIVRGKMDEITLSSFLTALKIKGETPDEIAGAAFSLRDHSERFDAPDYVFADSCGTGGDKQGTINVSTAAAFLAAECGLPIVKHGNRSITSKCGSADVLGALGANIDLSPRHARRVLDCAGIAFLFAPNYHPGIKNAMGVRQQLATRTIFNVLGPLINPARPPIQLLGVYSPELTRPLAETLRLLRVKSALVVHGSGLDEIATHDISKGTILKDGILEDITITPELLGIDRHPLDHLLGGMPQENAAILVAILRGKGTRAQNDFVAANTGPLLYLAGIEGSLAEATRLAKAVLASGRAYDRMLRFIKYSNMDKAA
jgi:anthranilate phosphoribosyltransferase